MFERFRRSSDADDGRGSVAARDRELDPRAERVDEERFDRESPGERDRGVVAGEGERDLAADRSFEHDEMARGGRDATLDRDAARDDMSRDDAVARDRTLRDDPDTRDDGATRDDDRDRHHAGTVAAAGAGAAAGAAATHHHDREREAERDEAPRDDTTATESTRVHDRDLARDDAAVADRDDGLLRHDPVLAPEALKTMRARQRDRFGGIQWGSDFFGWLCAIGLGSLLTAALVGAGVALGLTEDDASSPSGAQTIGVGGGIALVAALAVAWFCGGYVAGRMARFDGARQGVGVWLWTLLAAVVVAVVAAIGGAEYDVFERLNLPRIAVGDTTLTAGGAIAGAIAVVVTLLFAVGGGKAGERFHKRVDRVATDEFVEER